MNPSNLENLDTEILQRAAKDFRFLLDRGYPRKAALDLVGNRHGLIFEQRHLLHRGVFSQGDSKSRKEKKVPIRSIGGKPLAIDGHNVLITVEAGMSGRPLVMGDDGFIRDISGLSGSFRKTESSQRALHVILKTLNEFRLSHTLFLFDAPMSNSGRLASEVRNRMRKAGIPGDALAIRVPETILVGFPGLVATSDTAIIDRSSACVVDLAGEILRKMGSETLIRWRRSPLSSPSPL
jgi:hypothetical protein